VYRAEQKVFGLRALVLSKLSKPRRLLRRLVLAAWSASGKLWWPPSLWTEEIIGVNSNGSIKMMRKNYLVEELNTFLDKTRVIFAKELNKPDAEIEAGAPWKKRHNF